MMQFIDAVATGIILLTQEQFNDLSVKHEELRHEHKHITTQNIQYELQIDQLQRNIAIATHSETILQSKLMEYEETIKQLKAENDAIKKQNTIYKKSSEQKQNMKIYDDMINIKIDVNVRKNQIKQVDNLSESTEISASKTQIVSETIKNLSDKNESNQTTEIGESGKLTQNVGVLKQAPDNNVLSYSEGDIGDECNGSVFNNKTEEYGIIDKYTIFGLEFKVSSRSFNKNLISNPSKWFDFEKFKKMKFNHEH